MTILNKTDLFYSLYDAFRQDTDSLYFVDGDNPYRFCFKGKFVCVFIGNVHFAKRADPDEYRIQCPGDLPERLASSKRNGDIIFVLGFSADVHTFSAWDPDRFLNRNPRVQRFSVYTRLSRMQEAATRGLSSYTDTDGQNVLIIRPDHLGLYIENSRLLHRANTRTLRKISEVYSNTRSGHSPPRPIKVNKEKIQITSTEYPRSPKFRQEVLYAYAYKCAVCGIQLDLIDAAHIIPHAHPNGDDIVTNGLALCSLHHRSFDAGLLFVRNDYSIHLNSTRVKHLKKMGRSGGLKRFTRHLRNDLLLPAENSCFPEPNNLTLGNRLRGV